jgi:hypothetical protein
MSLKKTLINAGINAAINTVAAPIETAAADSKPKVSPEKLRAIVGSGAFGVMLAAQMLANKDADSEGVDDYFASKLLVIAGEMQTYAFTGKLPSGFAA